MAYERRYAISLPDGYRRFLRELGNGGMGPPCYGLIQLGKLPANLPPIYEEAWGAGTWLSKPFPRRRWWAFEGVADEERDRRLRESMSGNLLLGSHGCMAYYLLIVTGAERGQVWLITDVAIGPTRPNRGFLTWYERWLDHGEDGMCASRLRPPQAFATKDSGQRGYCR